MNLIVKDRGGDWYFDSDKTYFCLDKDKNKLGKIYAEYVPDPVLLWKRKCEQAGITINHKDAHLLKPSNVVYKLWEHKNANFDN